MALTERANWVMREGGKLVSIPVEAGTTIYDGALVGLNVGATTDGRARNWSDLTADTVFFLGVARVTDQTDAAVATGEAVVGDTAGSVEVGVDISGVCLKGVAVTGASALTRVGDVVYASDENTLTITATGGANPIGWISRWITGTTCDVEIFSANEHRAYTAASTRP